MGDIHQLILTEGKHGALQKANEPREVVEAASLYMADEDSALSFAYSGWAQMSLPHRRIPIGEPWEVVSGNMRLVVEPGRKPTGSDGSGPLEFVCVPFGAHARLLLLYLQTQALRTQSREVELGHSWRDWMGRIGIPWGGKSGKSLREQAELLSRCKLTFHVQGNGKASLLNQSVVDQALFMDAPGNGRQGRLSLEVAKLSEGFFEALKKHPIPLEEAAIRVLANNSAALDCYVWLAYRLHSLPAPRLVPWPALKAQHGTAYRELFHFKPRFLGILAMAMAVYPDAKVDVQDDGILLRPSKPPVSPKALSNVIRPSQKPPAKIALG
jgi:hypothetical protein